MKPHLLYLVHRIPYPPNKGDKIRSYHFLKYLSEHYQVHCGAFIDDPNDEQYREEVAGYCTSVCLETLKPAYAKLRSLIGLVTGQAMSLPYYHSHCMQRWVENTVQAYDISVILVFSSQMAQYAEPFSQQIKTVIDFVDVDSDKWAQYSQQKSWPLSSLYRREARYLFDYEKKMAAIVNQVIFVSKGEASLFEKMVPGSRAKIGYINNGVDEQFFQLNEDTPNPYQIDGQVLVFAGAMDYWPNVDAVIWFSKVIFSVLHQQDPTRRLYIVGSQPTPSVLKLDSEPGIKVVGRVDSIVPYLQYADLVVAPLRVARGVQNKVLEAMAMKKPLLATVQAMEGIDGVDEIPCFQPNDTEEILRFVSGVLSGTLITEDWIKRGTTSIEQHYQWRNNCKILIEKLQQ